MPALILLALAACGPKQHAERPPLRVLVETAQPRDYAVPVVLTGDVAARVTSNLSFRIAGQIRERKAEVGDHVDAGQVLAVLDPTQQTNALAAAQADVDSAQARLTEADATFSRQRSLIDSGFTTRRDHDAAEAAFRSAEAALQGAQARYGNVRDELDQTVLRAAAPGVVTARWAEAGEVVQVAQSVFTVAQDGSRDAVFNAYEAVFTREPVGDVVEIALLSDPSVRRRARLRDIAPVVDPDTGTVRVKFDIIDPGPEMTLGAPLRGVGRFKPDHVVLLSWTALSASDGNPAVWVVDPATKAVSLKPVTIAGFETGRLLIRDGLSPDDLVVVQGQQLLWPGRVVEAVTPADQARGR